MKFRFTLSRSVIFNFATPKFLSVYVCWKFGERQIIIIITLKGNLRKEINFQRVENFWSKYIRGRQRGKIGIVYQCQKQKLEAPS